MINLKGYKLFYQESARKNLKNLDPQITLAIEEKLKDLVEGVEGLDIKKLKGFDHLTYRLRHGQYRIIYEVHNKEIIVLVVAIGHRQSIYKRYRSN
jgi:mRNA interferase RelE/StbE